MAPRRMRIFRRLKDSRGTNLLEGAILTPILLLVTFAIVDFGLFFYVYLALENGVSQATRFGITGQTMAGMNRVDSIKAAMRNATPTLTLPDAAFSFSSMTVGGASWSPGPGTPGQILRVTVTYPWEFWTPLIRPFFTNGRVNISVDSIMVTEPVFTQ